MSRQHDKSKHLRDALPRDKEEEAVGYGKMPFHITVQRKRKAMDVLNWGSEPLAVDDNGHVIPNGFCVRTYYKGIWFTARTRVLHVANKVKRREEDWGGGSSAYQAEFQFISSDLTPNQVGGWSPTSTGALQSVVDKLGNRIKCARGSNGALQIGVTYPNVQRAIRDIFATNSSLPGAATAEMKREEEVAMECQLGGIISPEHFPARKKLVLDCCKQVPRATAAITDKFTTHWSTTEMDQVPFTWDSIGEATLEDDLIRCGGKHLIWN